jgi:hypothetical protein
MPQGKLGLNVRRKLENVNEAFDEVDSGKVKAPWFDLR